MGQPIRDQVTELIPAFALGALDSDEAEVVSQHLAGCTECRAELVRNQAVVDLLPLGAPEVAPSPALKGRLLEGFDRSREEAVPAAAGDGSSWSRVLAEMVRSIFAGPRWKPALAIFILVLLVGNVILWQQLQQNQSAWGDQIPLAGTEAAPEAVGIIYISRDGRDGTLVVDGLPILEPDLQYQLWLVKEGERASGAIFSVNDEGYKGIEILAPIPLYKYTSFGISVEPAGGSPGPTGPRVLGYNPDP